MEQEKSQNSYVRSAAAKHIMLVTHMSTAAINNAAATTTPGKISLPKQTCKVPTKHRLYHVIGLPCPCRIPVPEFEVVGYNKVSLDDIKRCRFKVKKR